MSRARISQWSWSVKAASVAGAGHRQNGLPCQDAHHWRQLPGGVLVAAIADGAGSAFQAELGARVASAAAVAWLCEKPRAFPKPGRLEQWQELLGQGLQAAGAAVAAEAVGQSVDMSELATTLILLVAAPDYVAAAQVGDGAVVVAQDDENLIALTLPQRGEYCNETLFLHSEAAIDQAQISVWEGAPHGVAMLTDGLQMLALNWREGVPHRPFFAPLWKFARETIDDAAAESQLVAFLQSPRIASRTDDDLTLLLASLRDAPPMSN